MVHSLWALLGSITSLVYAMEVTFVSQRLRSTCSSRGELERLCGAQTARELCAHLADLRSAESLDDLRSLPGGCHPTGKGKRLSLDSNSGGCVVFEPVDQPDSPE